ncbi:hypothetical protein L3X37_07615 [Sabulilitoribacter arenilitoris]|uniref:Uncharacterized protein n=1 Tax=Wocania arenilitoris TaxID=2044858 RepID=A0AAE3EQC0_9FLAO|nr:DUF6786 family protein [Wocania arenilitoris]MCF7568229.1 hypothetical protein [Wocania arenilitoris]
MQRLQESPKKEEYPKGTFGYDRQFLMQQYKNTIVLENSIEKSSILVSPELQGRVMTSSLNGNEGMSFGWINHDLIASGELSEQFNAFGGEERFWLGPEGGQFSLYFPENVSFDFKNWKVPTLIDSEPFEVVANNKSTAVFNKKAAITNYSGTTFNLDITRTISLISKDDIKNNLGLIDVDFSAVAFKSKNKIVNQGNNAWTEDSGVPSIWILCMLNPAPAVTVVAPIKEGGKEELGAKVNDNYFGKVDQDRLKATDKTVFFKADGKSRGKIGFSPKRATKFIGSYDANNKVLTILEIDEPRVKDKYVNSAWEIQENPFSGDVINSYNDGPLENGEQLGPFYELESSSPALFLKSKESYTHTQTIYHFSGTDKQINALALKILGVSVNEIEAAL